MPSAKLPFKCTRPKETLYNKYPLENSSLTGLRKSNELCKNFWLYVWRIGPELLRVLCALVNSLKSFPRYSFCRACSTFYGEKLSVIMLWWLGGDLADLGAKLRRVSVSCHFLHYFFGNCFLWKRNFSLSSYPSFRCRSKWKKGRSSLTASTASSVFPWKPARKHDKMWNSPSSR